MYKSKRLLVVLWLTDFIVIAVRYSYTLNIYENVLSAYEND